MPPHFLNELKDGDSAEGVFLLVDKQVRANRNGNQYLLASLRDKTGQISGLMWNVSDQSVAHINANDFVRIKGKVQLYQGALQMILTHISTVPNEGLDINDFVPSVGQNVERLLERCREILLSMDDPALRSLMECFLIDEPLMRSFCQAPAGVKAHHAFRGGLIEHVVNMLETADRIADLYPTVNKDLLLAGIFLHDLGKVRELGYETNLVYTDEGQLVGHLVIAVELLAEKIQQTTELTGEEFPEETKLRLKHMILSHHGSHEFGSPKVPMTPEAIALHHLDNLDAKVYEFSQAIRDDPNAGSNWTPFSHRIGRKLYKGENDTDDR